MPVACHVVLFVRCDPSHGGGKEVLAGVWWKGLRETDHWKEQDVDGSIIRKRSLKNYNGRV